MFNPGALYQYQKETPRRIWFFDLKRGKLTWCYQIYHSMIAEWDIYPFLGDTIMFLKKHESDLFVRFSFLYEKNIVELYATINVFQDDWIQLT